jgi:hypothetical protein
MKLVLACVAASWLVAPSALARVERFAVIVGNNRGSGDDAPLRYAEADAMRVYDVLVQLGDFSPLNLALLRGQSAERVRFALLAVNERIRELRSLPEVEVVLFIYYSGHADNRALHLNGTELALEELSQHARGSAANFRLVVLDACRSGALTRVKGGRVAAPFALPLQERDSLPGDGFAFLTASSANEDAQESDALQGPFFTHAFVSGLLGAADSDGDGVVVLDEAYRYAYEATLRATSRTFAGTQHPTCSYGLRGRGRVVLTRPSAFAAERANLEFPAGFGFLLMQSSADGAVVVELDPSQRRRRLSLPPGRYFVRARAPDVMYEGTLDARSGATEAIDLDGMSRIEYARLVRKGARDPQLAHGPEVGVSQRSPLPNSPASCFGGFVGYSMDFNGFGARIRAAVCASEFQNASLRVHEVANDIELGVYHAWDISRLTLAAAIGSGLSAFDQRFDTRGFAPARLSLAPFVELGASAQLSWPHGLYTGLNVDGQTHFLHVIDPNTRRAPLRVGFALRTSLMFGKHF